MTSLCFRQMKRSGTNELEDGSQRPTIRSAVGVHPDDNLENDLEVAPPDSR